MDTRTKEKRRQIMASVRSKNTRPELLVRRFLWSKGLRYRVHVANLPGTPDIAFTRQKLAIFIHGCFWHGHDGCSRGRLPKSRVAYWSSKIEATKFRDAAIAQQLKLEGWSQLVVWECQIRTKKAAPAYLPKLLNEIRSLSLEIPMGPQASAFQRHVPSGAF